MSLVDAAGIVRWAHADPEYKVRPSSGQLLTVIDATLAAAGAGAPEAP